MTTVSALHVLFLYLVQSLFLSRLSTSTQAYSALRHRR